MSERSWLRDEPGRLRAGWRVLLFVGLFMALSLVGQLVASVLPRDPLGWVGLLVTTAAALVAGWVMLARYDDRSPGALGFAWTRAAPREIGAGFVVGAALLGGAALLVALSGGAVWVREAGTVPEYAGALLWMLLFFGLASAAEEALFRGYPYQALVEGLGVWPATLLASALFAAAHLGNPNIDALGFGNIFLASVLLSVAYLRTRSLWFPTALHAAWNWTMAGVLDFPVSGLTQFDTPLYDAVETGRDWWTGGEFGPEAGLAATLVLLAGTAWLLRTRLLREDPEMRRLRPLVDERLPPEAP